MSKKDYYAELTKEFPKEAMTSDSSRGFALTSIKAQYVRERLNEVMGPDGWDSNTDVINIDAEGNVAVKFALTLHFPERSVTRTSFGGAKKKAKGQTHGDIYKSAETDALSKAASNFGVGNSVFKGLVDAKTLTLSGVKSGSTTTKKRSSFNPKKAAAPTESVATGGDDFL